MLSVMPRISGFRSLASSPIAMSSGTPTAAEIPRVNHVKFARSQFMNAEIHSANGTTAAAG